MGTCIYVLEEMSASACLTTRKMDSIPSIVTFSGIEDVMIKIIKRITAFLPGWAKAPLRSVKDFVQAIPYYGSGRLCPVCGNQSRRFTDLG